MNASSGWLEVVEEFVVAIQKAACLKEVEALLASVSRYIGFRHYAMIHHDDARERRPTLIHMQNYPAVYAERYIAHQMHRDDPVILACLSASACFCWDDLPLWPGFTDRHRRFLDRGAREGVRSGITVPAFVLGERSGSCNFSAPLGPDVVRRHVGIVQMIGSLSFQAARRIILGGALRQARANGLSPRERECIILAGQGKSNTDIGTILGLSPATVKTYIAAACRRYQVHNRTQLAIAAALDGEIGVHEISPRQYRFLAP